MSTASAPTSARYASSGWRAAGWTMVAATAAFAAVGVVVNGATPTRVVAAFVAVGAAVVLRRSGAAGAVAGVVVVAGLGVVCFANPTNVGWFGVCVAIGWAAVVGGAVPAVVVAVPTYAVLCLAAATTSDPGWFAWIGGVTFTVVATPMAHRQRELYERLRAAQDDLAAAAATTERARIARELHDVIGHSLTVSLLHVTSARLALAEDPAEAEAALAEAERLGQQSLAEVRHAVGLLRTADADGSRPLPGGADLDDLVDGFRRAGMRLDVGVEGDPASLPATTGLTLYRILQESLTNATRHAPGAPVRVRLRTDARGTELVVVSGGPATGSTPGAGLVGMRERAEAVDGTLEAGPAEDGWRVRATLPAEVRA